MTEIFNAVIVFLLFTLLLIAFFIVVGTLFPKRVAKTEKILNLMPGRALAVGLVNFVFFVAVGAVLLIIADKIPDPLKLILTLPALVIFGVLGLTISVGLTGMVNLIGERIASGQRAWQRTLWGTLLLGIACAVPFLGWFLLLPYVTCAGIGAFITSFFHPDSPALAKE